MFRIIVSTGTVLALAAPSQASTSQVPSMEASSYQRIAELTRQALLAEIELQRFNLNYTLEVAKQGRWKGWRYGLLQEANGGLNLAGGIISTVNRGGNLRHPQ